MAFQTTKEVTEATRTRISDWRSVAAGLSPGTSESSSNANENAIIFVKLARKQIMSSEFLFTYIEWRKSSGIAGGMQLFRGVSGCQKIL